MIRFCFFFFTMNFIHITNVLMFDVIVLLDITFTCTLTLFRYIYIPIHTIFFGIEIHKYSLTCMMVF